MKHFDHLTFDAERCQKEATQLGKLLSKHQDLNEREQIQPFFEKRRHLSALIAAYNANVVQYDRLAYQYQLFGDFTCDVVVGDSLRRAYTFIEFEDAGPKSLFVKQGKKATREWSPRFDHGYSQIIDWFYKLHDMEKSDEHEARFGARSIKFSGVLVLGRDRYLLPGEKARLEWRRDNVAVGARNVHCVTFDGLLGDVLGRLKTFELTTKVGG